jgi:hypothetical protein
MGTMNEPIAFLAAGIALAALLGPATFALWIGIEGWWQVRQQKGNR